MTVATVDPRNVTLVLRRRCNKLSGMTPQRSAWLHDLCVALAEHIRREPDAMPQDWVCGAVDEVVVLRKTFCERSVETFLREADLALAACLKEAGVDVKEIYSKCGAGYVQRC